MPARNGRHSQGGAATRGGTAGADDDTDEAGADVAAGAVSGALILWILICAASVGLAVRAWLLYRRTCRDLERRVTDIADRVAAIREGKR